MVIRARNPFAIMICTVILGSLASGCYTRLTHPKESFNLLGPDGKPYESSVATAILAPLYNRVLRERTGGMDPVYILQPGTRVRVEVYGHGINESVNIRPDGKIDLALIGDVQAAGRSIQELKKEVATRYQEFFVDPPQVILNMETALNQSEVLAGDVSVLNPTGPQGVVNLTGDEMLSEVLAEVGALHPKSEWNEVAIIRRGRGAASDERYLIISDIEKLIRYGDLDQDVAMRNGDVVFIPFEKNTLLEELFASVRVLGSLAMEADRVTAYVDFVEGF